MLIVCPIAYGQVFSRKNTPRQIAECVNVCVCVCVALKPTHMAIENAIERPILRKELLEKIEEWLFQNSAGRDGN